MLCTVGAGFFGWTLIQTDHVGVELSPDQKSTIPMSGLYVNVHASLTNLKPVACGNLGAAPSSSGGPGGY